MLQANITVSNNADWIQAFQWVDTGIQTPTLQSGGAGFTSAPSVVFSSPVDASGNLIAGGIPATGVATVSGGAVTGITLTNPGVGYLVGYPPSISFVGGGGSGAAAYTTVGNPISLGSSTLTLEVRPTAGSAQLLLTVGTAAPNTGITITNGPMGQFQIILPMAALQNLQPGQQYVHDLLRLRPDGYTERMWTGTLSVDGGVTR
jgi:hypothetical protein